MPLYESVFIARPDISAAQVENLTEAMTTIVKDNGGDVTKNEYWGLRNLAYRIKKNRKGHYSLLNIDAPSAAVKEMERNMRISEDVIRYLTVRVDELEEGPSAMMQSRSGRDDRGRGRDDRGRGRDDRDRGGRRDRDDRERGGRRDRDDRERESGDKPAVEAAAKDGDKPAVEAAAKDDGDGS